MRFGARLGGAAAGALLLLVGSGAVAQGHGAGASALDSVELGAWRLTSAGGEERRLCMRDRWAVIQIMHGDAQCQHFVMENGKRSITVRYTCPGRGHGRTSVAVETPRLMQVDTQGVRDGGPFSESWEARRVGSCN